ncbi:MAG: ABC transporter permease [Bacteroidales bacterium]
MINFITFANSEVKKASKIKLFWFVLLIPILVIFLRAYYFQNQLSENSLEGCNILKYWIFQCCVFFVILFPIIQALLSSALLGLEYKNNAFQMLYTLPLKRNYIYWSKLWVLIFWNFLLISFTLALLLSMATLFNILFPDAGFSEFDIRLQLIVLFAQIFFICCTISAIHLAIAYIWSNVQYSILIAIILTIFGYFAYTWQYIYFVPYASINSCCIQFFRFENSIFFIKEIWVCLGVLFVAILLGLCLNSKKNSNDK